MKKVIIIISIILFSIIGIIAYTIHRAYNFIQSPLNHIIITVDSATNLKLETASKESAGILIDTSVILLTSKNKKIKLSKLLKSPPKLIFSFEYRNCNECIERELNMLKAISKDFKPDKIIYLSNFENIREQKIFEKDNEIEVLNLKNSRLGLPIEGLEYPFLFVVDTNYQTIAVSPSVGLSLGLRPLYLQTIILKYFHKRQTGGE